MTEDVIDVAGLIARTWAEDIVQLQHTRAAHNSAAAKDRAAIVKALTTSAKKRKQAWCRRHEVTMSMLEWLTDNGGHLESTFEPYSFGLATRRYWSLTITRHVLRREFRKTDEDDDYGLLQELSAEFNRFCGGTDDEVIIEIRVVDLPGNDGRVRGGKGLQFVCVPIIEEPVTMQIMAVIEPVA